MEMIEYPKRTPGIRYSDEEEVLLNTPLGAASAVGGGPAWATCASCSGLDGGSTVMSDHGRASVCIKSLRLIDRRKGGWQPLVPLSMPSCSQYERNPEAADGPTPMDMKLARRIAEARTEVRHRTADLTQAKAALHDLESQRRNLWRQETPTR